MAPLLNSILIGLSSIVAFWGALPIMASSSYAKCIIRNLLWIALRSPCLPLKHFTGTPNAA
jgi:hypothetical protein